MNIILLDIGNVVLNVNFSHLCNLLAGGNKEQGDLIYKQYCMGAIKADLDCGHITPEHFFNRIASDENTKNLKNSEIKKHWKNIFSLVSGTKESVEKLKKYYSIWVVSDTDPIHFNFFINEFPETRAADRFYLSYSMGVLKSDPHFFSQLLEDTDLEPAEFILIDDKEENCRSAAQNGITSILFKDWQTTLEKLSMVDRNFQINANSC